MSFTTRGCAMGLDACQMLKIGQGMSRILGMLQPHAAQGRQSPCMPWRSRQSLHKHVERFTGLRHTCLHNDLVVLAGRGIW